MVANNKHAHEIITHLINFYTSSKSIGVEIGVARGSSAFCILNRCNIQHLYLVDPWSHGYAKQHDSNDVSQAEMELRYKKVQKQINKKHKNKATIVRQFSHYAHKEVPDGLDFIYIDGNHEYENVILDLTLWVPKIKSGGLVMGDDWGFGWDSVVSAVIDYCKKYNNLFSPNNYLELEEQIDIGTISPAPRNDPVVYKAGKTWWSTKK